MVIYPRILGIIFLLLPGCNHVRSRLPVSISVDQLLEQAPEFAGHRIRVTGYLLDAHGPALVDTRWQNCYGNEPGRGYVIVDLPEGPLNPQLSNPRRLGGDGRKVVVEGIFANSVHPWPKLYQLQRPDAPAVGPLKKARIVEVGDETCE
jgi:hypothetical protein